MEQDEKQSFSPGVTAKRARSRAVRPEEGTGGRWTSLEAPRATSGGSGKSGSGLVPPAFLSHRGWLSPPPLPGAGPGGPGGDVSSNSQAALSADVRQQTGGPRRRTGNPPVRWRDGEESARLQLSDSVPLLRPHHQLSPPLAPWLLQAHKEGWAAAATASA